MFTFDFSLVKCVFFAFSAPREEHEGGVQVPRRVGLVRAEDVLAERGLLQSGEFFLSLSLHRRQFDLIIISMFARPINPLARVEFGLGIPRNGTTKFNARGQSHRTFIREAADK